MTSKRELRNGCKSWPEDIKELVPLMFALSISSSVLSIALNVCKNIIK